MNSRVQLESSASVHHYRTFMPIAFAVITAGLAVCLAVTGFIFGVSFLSVLGFAIAFGFLFQLRRVLRETVGVSGQALVHTRPNGSRQTYDLGDLTRISSDAGSEGPASYHTILYFRQGERLGVESSISGFQELVSHLEHYLPDQAENRV